MKTVIIVQARMTSTRLPGKVLKTILDKPLLEYHIERLRRVNTADEIIIATTTNDTDLPIVQLCERLNITYFRGSEDDVLSRYYHAANLNQGDVIVRITSDCPVIDPKVIDLVIGYYLEHRLEYDYVSNTLVRSYPRGMDTEVFSFKALSEAFLRATTQIEREHVTPFIYNHPEVFKLANIAYPKDYSHHRWTVDTLEDFELICKIIENLYPEKPNFTLEDIFTMFKLHPEWSLINTNIKQKTN